MEQEPSPQEQRRQAFIDAARVAFFTHGYGATSMSAIAAAVGGSKTTLWSYFASKPALFAAVVDDLVERFGQALEVPLEPDLPLRDALHRFGHGMMGIVLQPDIVALHRVVTGEAARFPELGRLFFERGPKRGKGKLAVYFAGAMEAGRMRAGDPAAAARHFAALCQAGVHNQLLWGLIERHDDAELEADIDAAIDVFVRAWGRQR